MHLVKILGACPRKARPYKIRDEQKKYEFAALNALVVIPALMMLGKTVRINENNHKLRGVFDVTFNPSSRHRENIGRLGGSTRGYLKTLGQSFRIWIRLTLKQARVIVRNDEAGDEDTENLYTICISTRGQFQKK